MIPDSVAVLLLLALVATWVWGRHQQAMQALAYLEGFIDARRVINAAPASVEKPIPPPKVYDWATEGL